MYKGGRIIASLIIFVAFLSFPFFSNMGKVNASPDKAFAANLSQLQQAGKQCVEPASYMRANHMQLLLKWRASDVREGKTIYVNSQGKSFDISLQSCLECHATPATQAATNPVGVSNPALNTSSDQFCVSCHNYASVKPTCWSCHAGPEGVAAQ
ncbi:MAG TPA: sulfate reduction electron transfer complex DsrMKJOP subunit DsrJ [Desulfosporosinus sp.]